MLENQGDIAGSRRLKEQALEALTFLLGAEHPDTFTTLLSLGHTHLTEGDLDRARVLFEQVVEGMTRTLGEEHPKTLIAVSSLGVALHNQRDLAGARLLHERVLEARIRVLGLEHPDTQKTRLDLFRTLVYLRDYYAWQAQLDSLDPLLDADPESLTAAQRSIRDEVESFHEKMAGH